VNGGMRDEHILVKYVSGREREREENYVMFGRQK
jgi:hypothetical protein